jgi:hypothetical protein
MSTLASHVLRTQDGSERSGEPAMRREDLKGKEQELWDAFAEGRQVTCDGPDPIAFAGSPDEGWSDEQRISGDVISTILRGTDSASDASSPALWLRGARITGTLDVSDAVVDADLILEECYFDNDMYFDGARIRVISLENCVGSELSASRLEVQGGLSLETCRLEALTLSNATINGNLRLIGVCLTNPGLQCWE